jgi:amino-acid N-acetyltransferase
MVRPMKTADVICALGALAHEHRLAIYRLLVERGIEGLPAGAIGDKVGLVPSSLTFHLQALQRAGLITQLRVSRQLIYSADYGAMNELVGYLTENCCAASGGGGPAPLIASRRVRQRNPGGAMRPEPLERRAQHLVMARPDLAAARALLASAGLPTEDLTDQHCEHFFYLGSTDAPRGLIGLEIFSDVALMRSLVVDPGERGKGAGSALVVRAEQAARDAGVRTIYLLTTTAESFFARRGYQRMPRESAPPAIRATREFAGLCPSGSAFMIRTL